MDPVVAGKQGEYAVCNGDIAIAVNRIVGGIEAEGSVGYDKLCACFKSFGGCFVGSRLRRTAKASEAAPAAPAGVPSAVGTGRGVGAASAALNGKLASGDIQHRFGLDAVVSRRDVDRAAGDIDIAARGVLIVA